MEEVIILSYYFPPANLPAAYRAYSWAKYMEESGYHPIVVTRKWETPIEKPSDLFRNSTPGSLHQRYDSYDAWYLPYEENLRDKIYLKYGENQGIALRKTLTFFESILSNYTNYVIPYHNIFDLSKKLLRERPGIKKMIITGNPFQLFRFGYLLNREFGIRWIADFRDEWSTTDWSYLKAGARRINFELEKQSEKKWIASASAITTVTPYFASKLEAFHHKPATVVYNGFYEEESAAFRNLQPYEDFTFTFAGTLYDLQKIELVLDVIKELITEFEGSVKIMVRFPGLGFEETQQQRIIKAFAPCPDRLVITPRISKNEILEVQGRSHVLLLPAIGELKGNIQSKLFDYIGLYKPVVLYPSDDDVLEKILAESGLGIIPRSQEELYEALKKLIKIYQQTGHIEVHPKTEAIGWYTRKKQTEVMGKLLDTL